MFDVGADPAVIAEQLSGDPLLKRACAAHAGIRMPGAWDPFELTVRAILGQQISVRGGDDDRRTRRRAMGIAGRRPDRRTRSPLSHTGSAADAPLEEAGIIAIARQRRCARWRAPSVTARSSFDGVSTVDALRAIPGHRRLDRAVRRDARAQRARRVPVGRSGAAADGRRRSARELERRIGALAALARLRGDAAVAGGRRSRSTGPEDPTCARGCTSSQSPAVIAAIALAVSRALTLERQRGESMVEIRSYNLKPGTRDRFHQTVPEGSAADAAAVEGRRRRLRSLAARQGFVFPDARRSRASTSGRSRRTRSTAARNGSRARASACSPTSIPTRPSSCSSTRRRMQGIENRREEPACRTRSSAATISRS